jgi:uncharacterized protein YijF (DUF1287 family)
MGIAAIAAALACADARSQPAPAAAAPASPAAAAAPASPAAAPLAHGVADKGIYPDLDGQVRVALPRGLGAVALVEDRAHGLVVLYDRGFPLKAYPTGGPASLAIGPSTLRLRAADRAELAPLAARATLAALAPGATPAPGDRDGDGLPDPLDVYLGGIKNALNAAPYVGGYTRLAYPGGDVVRTEGVCTDVIVRALRNAGIDLQVELARDIAAARRAYPMVRRPDRNIDHRRVKTILPWFRRHWEAHAVPATADDPLRPGDVLFFDTFPNKSGPDHIGLVSGTIGPGGEPVVINAWTDGYVANEMDLVPWVPITHRFRAPPADLPAPRRPD